MLTEIRQRNILALLQQKKIIKIEDVIEKNQSSISTVRRDLKSLEDVGKLIRIHGGAKLPSSLLVETDFVTKEKMHQNEKNIIGKYAASQINNNDVIFLDAGTSTSKMIPFLVNKTGLLVVTNGLSIANLLSDYDINTYVLGGQLKMTTRALIGLEIIDNIKKMQFDKCFMGVNGISQDQGFSTPDIQEAQIKTNVIKQSSEAYVLSDSSKFNKTSFVSFAKITDATIISDNIPDWVKASHEIKYLEVKK